MSELNQVSARFHNSFRLSLDIFASLRISSLCGVFIASPRAPGDPCVAMDRSKTDRKRTDDGVGTRGMEDLVLQVRGRSLAGSKVGLPKSDSTRKRTYSMT